MRIYLEGCTGVAGEDVTGDAIVQVQDGNEEFCRIFVDTKDEQSSILVPVSELFRAAAAMVSGAPCDCESGDILMDGSVKESRQ